MAAHQFMDMTKRHVRFAMSKRIGRNAAVTEQSLERENLRHRGTGGRSAGTEERIGDSDRGGYKE